METADTAGGVASGAIANKVSCGFFKKRSSNGGMATNAPVSR
jgi:hypothetical protein